MITLNIRQHIIIRQTATFSHSFNYTQNRYNFILIFFTHHKTTCKKQNKAILQIDLHRLPYVNSKYYLPNPKEPMHKQRRTSSPNERCNPRNNDPVLPVAVSLVLNW